MSVYEWRVTWTKDGWNRTQKKVFQLRRNVDSHLEWLKENAYRVVAVERRPVGDWEPTS